MEQQKVDKFIEDYRKLCEKHKMYLVYDDQIWLQSAGEDIDIDDAINNLSYYVNSNNS